MKLRIALELEVDGMTLLQFGALVDRIKHVIDPDGRRRAVMRLGYWPKTQLSHVPIATRTHAHRP